MLKFNDLPEQCKKALNEECDSTIVDPATHEYEVVADPNVYGTYAIRILQKDDDDVFILWSDGGIEDVEFESWPPTTEDLHFF